MQAFPRSLDHGSGRAGRPRRGRGVAAARARRPTRSGSGARAPAAVARSRPRTPARPSRRRDPRPRRARRPRCRCRSCRSARHRTRSPPAGPGAPGSTMRPMSCVSPGPHTRCGRTATTENASASAPSASSSAAALLRGVVVTRRVGVGRSRGRADQRRAGIGDRRRRDVHESIDARGASRVEHVRGAGDVGLREGRPRSDDGHPGGRVDHHLDSLDRGIDRSSIVDVAEHLANSQPARPALEHRHVVTPGAQSFARPHRRASSFPR